MLNDFLHSVVQLCGFSPLSMNMCSFNFPVCVNDFFHCAQCEWPYECSDFELGWITFCILCTCVVSLHWGWACVGLCDCRIVAFFCILSSVCFAVISHERLFLWKSCIGCTYGSWELKKKKTGSGWPFLGRKLGLYIALGTALEKKRQRSSVRGCRETCSMKLCSCLT